MEEVNAETVTRDKEQYLLASFIPDIGNTNIPENHTGKNADPIEYVREKA